MCSSSPPKPPEPPPPPAPPPEVRINTGGTTGKDSVASKTSGTKRLQIPLAQSGTQSGLGGY